MLNDVEQAETSIATRSVAELSDALAEAFRTGHVGDAFTDDVFFDGHPPFWRFQLPHREAFGDWLRGYTAHHPDVDVVRTIPTESGFVTEHNSVEDTDAGRMTSRKILLCEVRDGRIAALTVYCSGDWDAELRSRHAAEAPILRP